MATRAPLLAKEGKAQAHSKASIFYGADEYLEELKRKYAHDHEIAALKNALPGEGDPNAAGVAQSSDKMLSVQRTTKLGRPLGHFRFPLLGLRGRPLRGRP